MLLPDDNVHEAEVAGVVKLKPRSPPLLRLLYSTLALLPAVSSVTTPPDVRVTDIPLMLTGWPVGSAPQEVKLAGDTDPPPLLPPPPPPQAVSRPSSKTAIAPAAVRVNDERAGDI